MPADPTIGIVTDSNSQLTAELAERFGVEVVPMTVTIDGDDHLILREDDILGVIES